MTVHRLPERAAESVALPPPEAIDALGSAQLVETAVRLAAILERVRARLMLVSGQQVGDVQRGMVPEQWLDTRQAAAHLGVPCSWVAEKARAGQLRSHKLGHYVRFRRGELDVDVQRLTKAQKED